MSLNSIDMRQQNSLAAGARGVRGTSLGTGVPGAGMPHSIPGARTSLVTPQPVQTASHTASTNTNLQTQVQHSQATSQPPGGSTSASVQDNTKIQGSIEDGNVTLEQMLSVLQGMYRMMIPKAGTGGAGAGSTASNIEPDSPASYFRSPCSDLNATAGKSATNMAARAR